MRVYSPQEEENVRARRTLRDWQAQGFLTAAQKAVLDLETDPGLQLTTGWLRLILFIFSLLGGAAFIALLSTMGFLNYRASGAWLVLAGLSYGLAEYVIHRSPKKPYRYGVEEASVVLALAFLSFGVSRILMPSGYQPHPEISVMVALITSAACAAAYARFGYFYAALGSIICFAWAITSQITSPWMTRSVIAAFFGGLALILVPFRHGHRDDFRNEELGALQATLILGTYFTLNVRMSSLQVWSSGWAAPSLIGTLGYPNAFYWITYFCILFIPGVTLMRGIQQRDRSLLNIGIVIALLTLVTNKPYLGLPRHEWDPMLLGLFLMGIAIGIRRWLTSGPGGERSGYTAVSLSARDKRLIGTLGTVSAVLHPGPASPPAPQRPDFGGGRSGGGGAQGTF